MEPVLSSPKLISDDTSNPTSPVIAIGKKYVEENPSIASSSSSSSASESTSITKEQEKISSLERELAISKARNTNLERSLTDARKSAREREELLLHLQWDPKDDYYAYKNPNNNSSDIKNLDEKEKKMMKLLEQMRIMEISLEEHKKQNEELQSKITQLLAEKASLGTEEAIDIVSPQILSPYSKKIRIKSPQGTLPKTRSPTLSPTGARRQQNGTPRWWILKKLTPSSSPVYLSRRGSSPNMDRSGSSTPNLSSEYGSNKGPGCISNSNSPSLNESAKEIKNGASSVPNLPNHHILSPAISRNSVKYVGQQA